MPDAIRESGLAADGRRGKVTTFVALLLAIVAFFAFNVAGVKAATFVSLEDLSTTTEVMRANGQTDHYDNAKFEYYALYLVPLALSVFVYMVVDKPAFKRVILGATFVYLVFYMVALGLELSPVQLNYSLMTSAMHPIAGIVFLLMSVALFAGVKRNRENHTYILRNGAATNLSDACSAMSKRA